MQTYRVQSVVMYHDGRPTKSEPTRPTDCQPDWFISEMAKYSPVYVWPQSDDPHRAGVVTVDLRHPGFTHRFYFLPIDA